MDFRKFLSKVTGISVRKNCFCIKIWSYLHFSRGFWAGRFTSTLWTEQTNLSQISHPIPNRQNALVLFKATANHAFICKLFWQIRIFCYGVWSHTTQTWKSQVLQGDSFCCATFKQISTYVLRHRFPRSIITIIENIHFCMTNLNKKFGPKKSLLSYLSTTCLKVAQQNEPPCSMGQI